jgi:hypothetical protein
MEEILDQGGDVAKDFLNDIAEYVPGSEDVAVWIEDLLWLYEQGREFIATLQEARDAASEDEESSDGGEGGAESDVQGAPAERAGNEKSAGTTAGTTGIDLGLPDLPSWDEIADDVKDELSDMVDVDELREHLPELSPDELISRVTEQFAEWVAEPLADVTNVFPDDAEDIPHEMGVSFPSLDGLDATSQLNIPWDNLALPEGVYGPGTGGDFDFGTASAAATGVGGASGVTATSTVNGGTGIGGPAKTTRSRSPRVGTNGPNATRSGIGTNRTPSSKAAAMGTTPGSQPMEPPLPTMEECPVAYGKVVAIPFVFKLFEDPTNSVTVQVGFWVGMEPGRPCLYWADENEVSVGTDPLSLSTAANENQDELNAVAEQLQGYVDSLASDLNDVVHQEGDLTYSEMLASVRTFRENGLERMGELLGEIDTAFENHTTEELRGQIDAVVSDLETLLAELEEWNLPDRAQEIVDAATAEGLDPEAAREIVDHVGTAAARNGDVAVGTIATVRDHASSLATWIDELSDATRRRIETAVPFDLDAFQEELSDLDHPVFDLAASIVETARQIVEVTLFGMQDEIKNRIREHSPSINYDLMPDLGCHATCSRLLNPSYLVDFVISSIIDTTESLVSAIKPRVERFVEVTFLALAIAWVIATFVILGALVIWALIFIGGEILLALDGEPISNALFAVVVLAGGAMAFRGFDELITEQVPEA